MKDARFTIPTAALLAKVVDLLDAVGGGRWADREHQAGDTTQYMLRKLATAGTQTASSAHRATSFEAEGAMTDQGPPT